MGYVGWDALLSSVVNSVTLLVQIITVRLGGGLVSLAVVAAAGALSQRLLIVAFVRQRKSELLLKRGRWRAGVFTRMLTPAMRAWLTALGYLLVANTDQFFITAHQGTAALPAYRAAFLLVINLHLLAGVFSGASQVFVSQLWEASELGQIRAILRRNAQIGLLAMACGGGAVLALGPVLFEFWLGRGNFIGYPVLGIFLATFMLEHHANVFGSCGRATNDEAYAASSLAAGALKVVLAFLLIARLGLMGLALSTLVAQVLTNDWFMVYRSMKRLGVNFGEHVKEVLAPALVTFLAALGLGLVLNALLCEQPVALRVGMVSVLAGLLLAGSVWRLALDGSQRSRVLRRIRFA
jgi:O-antigen/teichoic acid export membrane protein